MSANQNKVKLEITPPRVDTHAQQLSFKQVLDSLNIVAQAISQTFGSRCEVVIHDLTDPEHSIVSINGNLTGRKVGGSLTDLGLAVMESAGPEENVLIYKTQAPNGRELKSTSALLRDQNGSIFGAFCINLDIEAMVQVTNLLTELCQIPTTDKVIEEHFSDEPVEIITTVLHEELARMKITVDPHKLKREQRIEIVQAFQERGIFNMRNAPTIVANLLGVSRFTVYNYLNEARTRQAHEEIEKRTH